MSARFAGAVIGLVKLLLVNHSKSPTPVDLLREDRRPFSKCQGDEPMDTSEVHDYVHSQLERDLDTLVVEEEAAADLEVLLNELGRHGYNDIKGVTMASSVINPGNGRWIVSWRYVAVVRRSGQ